MTDSPWILLLYTLPAGRGSARVKFWRKLKKSGALPFKSSAYLLPNQPELLERFQWLAQQVTEAGGEASLAFVSDLEGLSNEALVEQFNEARALEYQQVASALTQLNASRGKKMDEAFSSGLEKIRRDFEEVRCVDFFDSAKGREVAALIERAATLHGKESPGTRPQLLSLKRFKARHWLTRPRPAIDRVGSAWLIKNYIDAAAVFVFGTDPGKFPGAIPYDMMGVEFTHHGDDCTFETLLKRFGLKHPALKRLAEMIHDADLADGKFQAVEAIGLDRVFKGWARLGWSDEEILSRGLACFDALHATLKSK